MKAGIDELPYLTADLPGIGGAMRQTPADFRVEELPLYEPDGTGTHLYFRVTKVGVPTPVAADRIARHMGVRPGEIGVAGLKDAGAVTSQTMSIEHADPARLAAFRDAQVQVTVLALHTNKLRTGHLRGNRFDIHLREVGRDELPRARAILDELVARGVPNYFGPQRFGARGDTAELGRRLVLDELDEFVATLLGRARPGDPGDCRQARDAFDAGFLDRAQKCWPRHYANERRALAAYKKKRRPPQAVAAVDKRMRRLYVSAFQSLIFNAVLARRINGIGRLMAGDLAQKHDTGGVFTVDDPAVEQARADRFEISPTGPIVGYRSPLAAAEAGQIERQAIADQGIAQDDFRRAGALKVPGSRRPLRARLEDCGLSADSDERGDFVRLAFSLPSGCYATSVLREVMKTS
jgi:tRNA pseudouridine13 synthase